MRGEPGDILIVKVMIVVAKPSGLHDNVNTHRGHPAGRGVSRVMLSPATIGDLLASDEVAIAFALRIEDCTGMLGATVVRAREKYDYLRMLDARARAAAVVSAQEEPNSGVLESL